MVFNIKDIIIINNVIFNVCFIVDISTPFLQLQCSSSQKSWIWFFSFFLNIKSIIKPLIIPINIFIPNTPLHDGAVVISNNKIAAAACVIPLADDKDIAKELGTRHRAALGISKESDSIAVVVSEETGKISVAKDGTLIADVKEDALKKILIKYIVTKRFAEHERRKFIDIIREKRKRVATEKELKAVRKAENSKISEKEDNEKEAVDN